MNSVRMLGLSMLILVSLLWGTSFPMIKIAVSAVGADEYVKIRFLMATLLLMPYFLHRLVKNRNVSLRALKAGTILGILYFGGIFLQGLGTKYTLASNSGFITSLYIPIVYCIDVLLHRYNYSHRLTLALLLSLIGIYLISGGSYESRIGDLLVFAGAFFWAFQILAVDRFSKEYSSIDLIFLQYALTALLGFMIAPGIYSGVEESAGVFTVLLYLAAVCSVLVGILQVLGQRYISASQTALVYALEPVFAALFSFIILGERLGVIELAGATLILISLILSLWDTARKSSSAG
ncbi:MAG: DMT family transporter [Thermoproteota archaeon]